MTSSFERKLGASPAPRDPGSRSRATDGPAADGSPNAYARFIPREEVRSFAAVPRVLPDANQRIDPCSFR